jgi:hypothetical protein
MGKAGRLGLADGVSPYSWQPEVQRQRQAKI